MCGFLFEAITEVLSATFISLLCAAGSVWSLHGGLFQLQIQRLSENVCVPFILQTPLLNTNHSGHVSFSCPNQSANNHLFSHWNWQSSSVTTGLPAAFIVKTICFSHSNMHACFYMHRSKYFQTFHLWNIFFWLAECKMFLCVRSNSQCVCPAGLGEEGEGESFSMLHIKPVGFPTNHSFFCLWHQNHIFTADSVCSFAIGAKIQRTDVKQSMTFASAYRINWLIINATVGHCVSLWLQRCSMALTNSCPSMHSSFLSALPPAHALVFSFTIPDSLNFASLPSVCAPAVNECQPAVIHLQHVLKSVNPDVAAARLPYLWVRCCSGGRTHSISQSILICMLAKSQPELLWRFRGKPTGRQEQQGATVDKKKVPCGRKKPGADPDFRGQRSCR